MSSPDEKGSASPVADLAKRCGIFVVHEAAGQPITVTGWRNGERRSLVVTQARALGLIQQLALAAANLNHHRISDDGGQELGVVSPQHGLTLIRDLAGAVRSNRAEAERQAQAAAKAARR